MIRSSLAYLPDEISSLRINARIEEKWIQQYVSRQEVVIPVNEQYNLGNLGIELAEGKLTLLGEIVEKPGSFIGMTCVPKWDADLQRLQLDDLQIQTRSKNILIKSAGWFAQLFLQNKIDSKVEQATNQMYLRYLEQVRIHPLNIPIPKGGTVQIDITNVIIREMVFLKDAVEVNALIEGHWTLSLSTNEE